MTAAALALVAGANMPGAGAGGVARSLLDPLSLVKWSVWNLAVYELALGVVALTLFPLALWSMLGSTVERERATGVALATSAAAILLSLAAVSTSGFGLDILHERYLFSVTPLVLTAVAYWLERGPPAVTQDGVDRRARRGRRRSEPARRPGGSGEQRRQPDRGLDPGPSRRVTVELRPDEAGGRRAGGIRGCRAPPSAEPRRTSRRGGGCVRRDRLLAGLLRSDKSGTGPPARVGRPLPPSRHSSLAPPPRLLASRPAVRGRGRRRAAGPRRLDGVLQHEHRPCLPLRRAGRARQPRLATVARRAGRRRLPGRAAVRAEVCRARLAPAGRREGGSRGSTSPPSARCTRRARRSRCGPSTHLCGSSATRSRWPRARTAASAERVSALLVAGGTI